MFFSRCQLKTWVHSALLHWTFWETWVAESLIFQAMTERFCSSFKESRSRFNVWTLCCCTIPSQSTDRTTSQKSLRWFLKYLWDFYYNNINNYPQFMLKLSKWLSTAVFVKRRPKQYSELIWTRCFYCRKCLLMSCLSQSVICWDIK